MNDQQRQSGERLANGLGWFSIGLGLAELVAPDQLARLIGVQQDDKTRNLLRFYGLREMGAGVGILASRNKAPWVMSRIGGDMLDIATLAKASGSDWNHRGKVGVATAAVLGVTALDVVCARQLSNGDQSSSDVHAHHSMIINKDPHEVYNYWRKLEQLPTFMEHLESVTELDERHSHWVAKGPAGTHFEWDAELTEDRRGEALAWRSLPGADVENSGSIRFQRAPGNRGTIMHVHLTYSPPTGTAGKMVAKLLGREPQQQVADELRHFKQIIETGEVVHSDASIHSRMHPAQPAEQIPQQLQRSLA